MQGDSQEQKAQSQLRFDTYRYAEQETGDVRLRRDNADGDQGAN